jgi:hypothetical protein
MELDRAIADVRQRIRAEKQTPPPVPRQRRPWYRGWRKGPFVVLAVFAYAFVNAGNRDAANKATDVAPVYGWQSEAPPGRIVTKPGPSVRDLEVADFQWSLQGFGNVMILNSVTVKNKSSVAWRDLAIVCEVFGKSGTKVGSTLRVIFDVVPAAGKKKFRDVNMGFVSDQAANANCTIPSAAHNG